MTQPALAELSGVNQSLISQLERSPTATGSKYTRRLAAALKISVDWLADEIGEMRPQKKSATSGAYTPTPKIVPLRISEPQDGPINELIGVAMLMNERGIYELIGHAKLLATLHPKTKTNHAK